MNDLCPDCPHRTGCHTSMVLDWMYETTRASIKRQLASQSLLEIEWNLDINVIECPKKEEEKDE